MRAFKTCPDCGGCMQGRESANPIFRHGRFWFRCEDCNTVSIATYMPPDATSALIAAPVAASLESVLREILHNDV